jgi:glycosyltransferase involved in cell wall biosynthesis
MRVLHVVADGDPGWAMTAVLAVIDSVAPARGVRHALVTETGSPLAAAARARGIPTVTRAFQRSRRFGGVRPRLVETVWELAPDVVHAHGFAAGHAVLPALSWLGLPMVLAMPAVAPPRLRLFARLQQRIARRAVLRGADVLLFGTQAELAAAQVDRLVGGHVHGLVAPPPLDLDALPERAAPQPIMLLQGRLHADFAVGRIVAALRGAPEPVRLQVIAEGPGAGPLAAALAAAGVDGRVDWLGRIPRQDALSRLAAAAVVIDPRQGSGVPIGLIEAAALGVPVITTERPALREALGVVGIDPIAPDAAWEAKAASVIHGRDLPDRQWARAWMAAVRGGEQQFRGWQLALAGKAIGEESLVATPDLAATTPRTA